MSDYTLYDYGWMVGNTTRWAAFQHALDAVIRPGDVVLDLGAGYGAMAFEALRRGASKVIAVEPADSIVMGRTLAQANGLADGIEHHRAFLEKLPARPVDVVIADLRGSSPFMPGHFEAIAHARKAWLRPGGRLVPLRDRLFVAPLRDAKLVDGFLAPWAAAHGHVDMQPARALLANWIHRANPKVGSVLGPGVVFDEVDYTAPALRTYGRAVELPVATEGPVHGLVMWFEAELAPGVFLSNRPDEHETVYGRSVLGFAEPLDVPAGGGLRVHVRITPVQGAWIWRWTATTRDAEGREGASRSGDTWSGSIVDPVRLARRAPEARPEPSEEARLLAFVLGSMDGSTSVADIAAKAQATFPSLLPDADAALDRVGALVERHAG